MKTITFEDHGQDFLHWDIENGKVVGCRPFQAFAWVGSKLRGKPQVGVKPKIVTPLGDKMTLRYKIASISIVTRKAVAA